MSSYHGKALSVDLYREHVDALKVWVPEQEREFGFEAIACTGISGMARAFPVSYLLGYPLIIVRKEGEKSHGVDVETDINASKYRHECRVLKYAILDDFVSSGETVKRVRDKIADWFMRCYEARTECVLVMTGSYHIEPAKTHNIPVRNCPR